jgi:hypothetical protein
MEGSFGIREFAIMIVAVPVLLVFVYMLARVASLGVMRSIAQFRSPRKKETTSGTSVP